LMRRWCLASQEIASPCSFLRSLDCTWGSIWFPRELIQDKLFSSKRMPQWKSFTGGIKMRFCTRYSLLSETITISEPTEWILEDQMALNWFELDITNTEETSLMTH
jgi:hypothetical protein